MGIWNKLQSKKKWNKGNDIYGVRGSESISHNDAEGKLDYLDKNAGFTRSSFYHSYFNGYAEVRRDRPGKPYKVERVYTAPWVKQDVSDRYHTKIRIIYGLMLVLSSALFIFGLAQRIDSNRCTYVAATGMPTAILMVIAIWVFVVYAKAPRLMTIWEHKVSSGRLWKACLAYSIGLAATSVSTIIYVILNPGVDVLMNVINIAIELLAASCCFFIFRTERNMKYIEIPNTNVPPQGSQIIH